VHTTLKSIHSSTTSIGLSFGAWCVCHFVLNFSVMIQTLLLFIQKGALRSFDASSDFLCITQLYNGALFFFVFLIRKRIHSYGLVWCASQCVAVCVDAPATRCPFEYHYQLPRGGWQKCRAGVGRIWGGHTIQWNFLNGAFFLWIQGIERWAFRVQFSSRKMGRESSRLVPNRVTIQLE